MTSTSICFAAQRQKDGDMRVTLRFADVFKMFGVPASCEIVVDRERLPLRELVVLAGRQDVRIAEVLQMRVEEGSGSARPAAVFFLDGRALSPDAEISGDVEIKVLLPVAGG